MSMLVGLWTIGSDAQRVASRPSAGLILRADSSGPTWATPAVGHASEAIQTPIAAQVASHRRGGLRWNIGSSSSGDDVIATRFATATGPGGLFWRARASPSSQYPSADGPAARGSQGRPG